MVGRQRDDAARQADLTVEMVEQRFRAKELSAKVGAAAVAYLPATRRTRQWTYNLHKATSGLTTLRKYIELYRQYTKTEMVFDDANTPFDGGLFA